MFELCVRAYLFWGDRTLLLRRHHVSFDDGLYSFAGGRVIHNEPALKAIHRMVQEEVALEIPIAAFTLIHTLHRKSTENEIMVLSFRVDISELEPHNNKPRKYDDMRFFKMSKLPDNIMPAHRQIIKLVEQGIRYSEHRWE